MRLIVFTCALALSGCAALTPEAVRVAVEHESHLTQHAPFTDRAERFGMNQLALQARWRQGGVVEEVSEGYAFHGLDGCAPACPTREVFRATVGYEWRFK